MYAIDDVIFFERFSAGARDERQNGAEGKRKHKERVLGR